MSDGPKGAKKIDATDNGERHWLAENVVLQQLCLSVFRTLTNREPKFLPPKSPLRVAERGPPADNPAP